MSSTSHEKRHDFEFKDAIEWSIFEQAVTNQIQFIDQNEMNGVTNRTDEPMRALLVDILDRAQRTRHANDSGPPITFTFVGEGEVIATVAALASAYEVTERVGVTEGHDAEEILQTTADLAVQVDELGTESTLDGIEIEFPYDDAENGDGGDA